MNRLEQLINRTHQHGIAVGRKIAQLTHIKRGLEKLNAERRKELKAQRAKARAKPQQFTMYDSIEVSQIPARAVAVAGYVGGKWPTYHELIKYFPGAKRLSIAINAHEEADCLDVEQGDARPDQVGVWVHRQKIRGVQRPCVYASLSVMGAVKADLAKHKIKRSEVRLWSAHYIYTPIIDAGFDATQYTDKALGRNLDASLCKADFL